MKNIEALLLQRGVTKLDIIECVYFLQSQYFENLDKNIIEHYVDSVLNKREVQHAIATGIAIDMACEQRSFGSEELQNIILNDEGLFGVDEVLAYGICNLYGSIALTNFGYIDKIKPGIIGILNDDHDHQCNTFLDDIVGAVAAAAASKLAHDRENIK
ncbi:MAG: phosphatidylglycerophosphatase A [Erysipelothrix sp.]|jgi:phosphatidylglycerophosphatase A|nr:phosphatidylglycerophosphatase A [Erysipelothrix sp.]